MKCACGVTFTTLLAHTECWVCRNLIDPPKRRPGIIGPLDLHDWWGLTGIGHTS